MAFEVSCVQSPSQIKCWGLTDTHLNISFIIFIFCRLLPMGIKDFSSNRMSTKTLLLLFATLLLQGEFSLTQTVDVQQIKTGNVAINKPEVNSEVQCQCTCNPVNNKNSVLFANGQLSLELQEQRENNNQQTTIERPPKMFVMKKTEPITPAKNTSPSTLTSNPSTFTSNAATTSISHQQIQL